MFEDLFGKKREKEGSIHEKLKILATNLEVLNEKLIEKPNSPNMPMQPQIRRELKKSREDLKSLSDYIKQTQEKVADKIVEDVSQLQNTNKDYLSKIANYINKSQENFSSELIENTNNLKTTLGQLESHLRILPERSKVLAEEIKKLSEIRDSLSQLSRSWLANLFKKIDNLNEKTEQLNKNLSNFYDNISKSLIEKVGEVSEKASSKIFKNMIWFILGIIVLNLIFSLIFNFILMKFI